VRSTRHSSRAQLQRALGSLGIVAEYVSQTNSANGHRAVGWYASVNFPQPKCSCEFCSAAKDSHEVYLGYHFRDALEEIAIYKHEHPGIETKVA
jgi:hypothetical protein